MITILAAARFRTGRNHGTRHITAATFIILTMIYWNMYYVSKRDSWLSMLTWGILGLSVIPALLSPRRTGFYILIPTMIFFGWIWLRTGYAVEGERLRILCGPFRLALLIGDIQRIRKTNSPLSSPALSLDRMEISFGRDKRVMVSPADKAGFLRTLVGLNPGIQLDEELKRLL